MPILRLNRQNFNLLAEFESESKLNSYAQGMCSNTLKSNVNKCTSCPKSDAHTMRIKYKRCTTNGCPNSEKSCFKVISCETNTKFSIWVSMNHQQNKHIDSSDIILQKNSTQQPVLDKCMTLITNFV